jgi:hypothetical protein
MNNKLIMYLCNEEELSLDLGGSSFSVASRRMLMKKELEKKKRGSKVLPHFL